MEEILKQILQELKEVKEGQAKLELGQQQLNSKIESVSTDLGDRMNSLEKRVANGFDRIENEIKTVYDKVGDLVEFKIITESKLE